jgi:PadR family transcriptional regulator PadR
MEQSSLDVVRGTRDVLILKTLCWGPMHGYAVTEAIHHQTGEALLVEEGASYPALHRMEAKVWIEAEWGLSDNNRRAKYYRRTPDGRRRLREEMKTWAHYAEAVNKVLGATSRPQWGKS